MTTTDVVRRLVPRPAGALAVHLQGDAAGPAVVLAHSILSSSAMWETQATLLAARGFYAIRVDARGHGASAPAPSACTMDALAADTVAVIDALNIDRAHYVGLSLGGMSGIGLGIHHGDRLLSLCLCDMRADTPPAAAAPWDERIATARQAGSCAPLADPTLERWFGRPFLDAHPVLAERLRTVAATTSVDGFAACAGAIQAMDYLPDVGRIGVPTTLLVGSRDGVLPQAMRDLQARIAGAVLEEIADAGHLPNVEQPGAFDAALLRHFARVAA